MRRRNKAVEPQCVRMCSEHGQVKYLVSKTQKNPGRGFHYCQMCQDKKMKFFTWQWCDPNCPGTKTSSHSPSSSSSDLPSSSSAFSSTTLHDSLQEEENKLLVAGSVTNNSSTHAIAQLSHDDDQKRNNKRRRSIHSTTPPSQSSSSVDVVDVEHEQSNETLEQKARTTTINGNPIQVPNNSQHQREYIDMTKEELTLGFDHVSSSSSSSYSSNSPQPSDFLSFYASLDQKQVGKKQPSDFAKSFYRAGTDSSDLDTTCSSATTAVAAETLTNTMVQPNKADETKHMISNGSSTNCCVVCLDAIKCIVCVPCGHVPFCVRCSNEIKYRNNKCPICRAYIDSHVKLFV